MNFKILQSEAITDPNKGLENQYVMQMMDAKMGKASSIYSNMNRKNQMFQNQEKVKQKIAKNSNKEDTVKDN